MPVRMRLKRFGSKGNAHYRIVLADARAARDGSTIEEIGYYDPRPDPAEVSIDQDRAVYWLMTGAQPTDTVRSLLRKTGVLAQLAEARRQRKGTKAPAATAAPAAASAPAGTSAAGPEETQTDESESAETEG